VRALRRGGDGSASRLGRGTTRRRSARILVHAVSHAGYERGSEASPWSEAVVSVTTDRLYTPDTTRFVTDTGATFSAQEVWKPRHGTEKSR
jgi:hypothetical protein